MSRFLIIVISIFMFSISPFIMAKSYVNGWSESTSKEFVSGCVDSYTKNQMNYMFSSGEIKQSATDAEIDIAKTKIAPIITAMCNCIHDNVMQRFQPQDVANKRLQPAYIIETANVCEKTQGLALDASRSNSERPQDRTSQGVYNAGRLIGFFLPIICIVAFAVWGLWRIFRQPDQREKHRSRW